jgi:hypothetical protein
MFAAPYVAEATPTPQRMPNGPRELMSLPHELGCRVQDQLSIRLPPTTEGGNQQFGCAGGSKPSTRVLHGRLVPAAQRQAARAG